MAIHLIIGGSGTIGAAVAARSVARGNTVILAARDPARLAAAQSATGAAQTHAIDASDFAAVAALAADVAGQFGSLDAVLNAAGSILLKPAHATTAADFAGVVSQNLATAFATVAASARIMSAQPAGGTIVLVSSVAARIGLPNHEAIAAAKAGIIGLTLSAAATYAAKNVRINCVAPALVDTAMAAPITGNPAMLKASAAMHPLGRIGTPAEVADLIDFVTFAAPWMTGQAIGLDGGMSAVRGR